MKGLTNSAYFVGQPDPPSVYDELLPYSGEMALVGNGVDVGGAVDSLLAGLALRLGRREEALERARRDWQWKDAPRCLEAGEPRPGMGVNIRRTPGDR